MEMLTSYNYDPSTFEYIGEVQFQPDPMIFPPIQPVEPIDDPEAPAVEPPASPTLAEMLAQSPPPASATKIAPPKATSGKVARWAGGAWELVVDQRGEYWTDDGAHHVITELGQKRPAGALDAEPPLPVHKDAATATRAAMAWIENFTHENVNRGKPRTEIEMYQGREDAARAIKAGTALPHQTAKLMRLLTLAGKTEAEATAALPGLCDQIIVRADARNTAMALTTAMRESVEAQIAAADPAADQFAFDKILAAAATDAAAKWADLAK